MTISKKPGKQRKFLYNAPLHKKRKWTAAHLAENLLLKYDRRSVPLIKGDTVKVMRGNFKGHEDKVTRVDVRNQLVEIEGVTIVKTDGKKIAKPLHASTLLITKLNLTDKWRREKLERRVSPEVKKEIEREAQEQIREQQEAQRKAEEAKAAQEAEQKTEETKVEAAAAEPETSTPEKIEEKSKPSSDDAPKTDEQKPASVKKRKPAKKKKEDEA